MVINNIQELKKVVKINATMPWEAIEPYLNDALEIYLEPHVGTAIATKAGDGTDMELTQRTARALGPLALSLATDEMSVRYGDAGITVDNEVGKRSPANEAKIAAAKQNLFYRGMQALDRLLDYLCKNAAKYPDYPLWVKEHITTGCYVKSAYEYQHIGMVQIEESTLAYRTMLPTMMQLQERHVLAWLKAELHQKLLHGEELTVKEKVLKELIIRYLCNRTAELYTSQMSHAERQNKHNPEYQPVIRPLYRDTEDNGNFFRGQADYYAGSIHQYLVENGAELGLPQPAADVKYNSKENKLFYLG